jgi:hypothetical protein
MHAGVETESALFNEGEAKQNAGLFVKELFHPRPS